MSAAETVAPVFPGRHQTSDDSAAPLVGYNYLAMNSIVNIIYIKISLDIY
jgi:hypothetical protein